MQAKTKKPEFRISGDKNGVVWGAAQLKDDYPHPVQRETIISGRGRAMLIKELIEVLKKYPPDIPVRIGWETTLYDITPEDIDIMDADEYIVITADDNKWF